MKRPSRDTPNWSKSSPPLRLELPAVAAWSWLWRLWCVALALTLALGAALPLWLRVCGLAALLPAAWLGCQLLRQRSGSAVQRLGWAPACGWWLQTVAGQRHYVQPDARAQSLGPWLLLVFRDGPTRFFILLDRLRAEPRACAALQALFALQTQRRQG